MGKWIIVCNPEYYNVVGAFNTYDNINWKQSVDIKVGDIVYIYIGKPFSAIKYETKVVQIDLPKPTIDDKEFIIDGSNYENYGRYMELRLLRSFENDLFSYDLLKENGLRSVQGPSRVSSELESFIKKVSSPKLKKDTRQYFFVFQNKSYDEEYKGGYLWAPQHGDNGRRVSHWELMKVVRKDDLIIHSYHKNIVAVSIAKSDVYESKRPLELPDQWNDKGWKVDTEYLTIENPIVTSEHMNKLMELQPSINAPFNRIGRGNTGYLFSSTKEMAEYIINESALIQDNEAEKIELLDLINNEFNSVEKYLDQILIDEIGEMNQLPSDEDVEYNPEPKKRAKPKTDSGRIHYPRDNKTSLNALARAKHKCEVDENHPSFFRKKTNLKYTEPHHLIPMSYQDLFKNSLDVEANIIALCSNCHNQIHYGVGSEELIEIIYKNRKEEIELAGISISLEDLLNLY
ncbi:HNH endonuclease [Gudongella sp. DL1XJH-153]|uniref:HNH endonuclease n=1 Tax=Gudongella sp. DL1XJH-153 TaxID=3409804 RepID=UPI003BB7FD5D